MTCMLYFIEYIKITYTKSERAILVIFTSLSTEPHALVATFPVLKGL